MSSDSSSFESGSVVRHYDIQYVKPDINHLPSDFSLSSQSVNLDSTLSVPPMYNIPPLALFNEGSSEAIQSGNTYSDWSSSEFNLDSNTDPSSYTELDSNSEFNSDSNLDLDSGFPDLSVTAPESVEAIVPHTENQDVKVQSAKTLDFTCLPTRKRNLMAAYFLEIYSMKLAQDIPFDQYAISPVLVKIAGHLDKLPTYPQVSTSTVIPRQLFRGPYDRDGPYLSYYLSQHNMTCGQHLVNYQVDILTAIDELIAQLSSHMLDQLKLRSQVYAVLPRVYETVSHCQKRNRTPTPRQYGKNVQRAFDTGVNDRGVSGALLSSPLLAILRKLQYSLELNGKSETSPHLASALAGATVTVVKRHVSDQHLDYHSYHTSCHVELDRWASNIGLIACWQGANTYHGTISGLQLGHQLASK